MNPDPMTRCPYVMRNGARCDRTDGESADFWTVDSDGRLTEHVCKPCDAHRDEVIRLLLAAVPGLHKYGFDGNRSRWESLQRALRRQ